MVFLEGVAFDVAIICCYNILELMRVAIGVSCC